MNPMSKRRSRQQRGYTAVEVLIAMTLFAIGAAGVIGMERVAIQGSTDARRFDVATSIASEWLSRLQLDATTWSAPGAPTTTMWLKDTATLANPLADDVGWTLPATPATYYGVSPAFDVLGRELGPGSTDLFYCVNYRLDWLSVNQTIRAEVRVFFPRFEKGPPATCSIATANASGARQTYHMIYATTTIRRNAQ